MVSIDVPKYLVELLFLRAIWGIDVPYGPPPCSSPPEPIRDGPEGFSPAQATAAWQALWREGVHWQPDGFPPSTFPPRWRERYGAARRSDVGGMEDQERAWTNGRVSELHELILAATLRPRVAQVLARAEGRGLHSIVALPLTAPWASWAGDGRVLVSGSTFTADDLITGALIGR